MTETLALIKQLHLRKLYIQEDIDELNIKKQNVKQQINKLILSIPSNNQRQPLRQNSLRSKFCTPSKISDKLAEFLGKEKGTMMARTDITREINKYIRVNNLQDSENKRYINPDDKLSSILNIPHDEQLTYFNLQQYISPHCFQ